MAGPATRFGTYKVTEWREGVQPQKTWIQKRIWKPRSSRFSSPTSIVCQGLVQTGLALHPMPMAGPATRFGTYKVTEWREGVQPQKTWIQKRIWKPRSSRFSSPTSIVCQGLVQTGLALHPMSRNRWSLEISSLKMFRLFFV